jgi:hypothetical protein
MGTINILKIVIFIPKILFAIPTDSIINYSKKMWNSFSIF